MTAPAIWPVQLPLRAARQSIHGQPNDTRVTFRPRRGLPIMRPGATARIDEFKISLPPVTSAGVSAFWTFFDTTLGGGSVPFAWIHPSSLEIRKVTFSDKTVPQEMHVGGDRYELSLQLLVPNVAPAWADYLTTVNGYMQIVDQAAWDAL